MTITASAVSPLNCRWISWERGVPVCTRPVAPPHCVSEAECETCTCWEPSAHATTVSRVVTPRAGGPDGVAAQEVGSCPRCGSHDVELLHRDAVVQSLTCAICHQRWLATCDL